MAELSKTPEEIKKGLIEPELFCEHCNDYGEPRGCNQNGGACQAFNNADDALVLIQQLELDKAWASENYDLIHEENKRLEAQNAELLEKIKQLERERDAAIYDLKKTRECTTCEYVKKSPSELPCVSCGIILKNYEWRGPCEENGGN